MSIQEKEEWAVRQLQEKSAQLGRLPKKDDFDEATIARIKAFLGPWPRALERAGLKEVRQKREHVPLKGKRRKLPSGK